jgi:rare lipoprotein A
VPDAAPRDEPLSAYGNRPYQVFGVNYTPMTGSNNYQERGIASWYGKKFHGAPTSSREPYDMYAMTAAHKTLPLPSYVRVRNLDNGREVVVRVNDRGPFLHGRLIDLSYAAAARLDIIGQGTGRVEVTRLFPAPAGPAIIATDTPPPRLYLQVGAFAEAQNADALRARLSDAGFAPVVVAQADSASNTPYRVRLGPLASVADSEAMAERLREMGLPDAQRVIEPAAE